MNEDFAPFELAVKLKEKGFREKCLYRYRNYSKTLHPNQVETKIARKIDYSEFLKCYNSYIDNDVDAPTIPQVLKWLRNTYNLHVETYPCGLGMWKFLVTNITTLEERALCDKYTSWEQATLVGISYVFDNLI